MYNDKSLLVKITRIIVFIPNFPFILPLELYVLYMISKESNPIELEFIETADDLPEEIKEFMERNYPKFIEYIVAISVYSLLAYYFFVK